MSKPTVPERAPHLILELSSGTAIVDGDRFELPQKEFQVLVTLAARPGEVVSKTDLIEAVWPDVPGMTNNDLYTQLSRLRKRIKDGKGRPAIIRNRPRFGYSLDLPSSNIEIVGVTASDDGEPTEQVHPDQAGGFELPPVAPADKQDREAAPIPALPVEPREDGTSKDVPAEELSRGRRRIPIRPGAVLVAAVLASLMVGGSWFAGYLISQRRFDAVAEGSPRKTPEAAPSAATEDGPKTPKKKGRTTNENRGKSGGGRRGEPADEVAGTFITSPGSGEQKSSGTGKSSGPAQKPKPPPPPPQPDAQLFHLHNPETEKRYTTLSSSAANQKQAAGYRLSHEGRVFTKHIKGTIAIALHDGSAYIYRARDAAPDGVSVTELYRLAKSGDFFYTKSSSSASQAEAQGWSRSVAGFVQ